MILKTIYDELATVFASVTEIEHFGMWNSQEVVEANEGAYSFPALLVEFALAEDETPHAGISQGEVTLRFYLQFNQTWHGKEPTHIWAVIDAVHAAMHLWEIDCAGPFTRVGWEQDTDATNLITWVLEYRGQYVDESEVRGNYNQQTTLQSIRLTGEIASELDGVSDPPANVVVIIGSGGG